MFDAQGSCAMVLSQSKAKGSSVFIISIDMLGKGRFKSLEGVTNPRIDYLGVGQNSGTNLTAQKRSVHPFFRVLPKKF